MPKIPHLLQKLSPIFVTEFLSTTIGSLDARTGWTLHPRILLASFQSLAMVPSSIATHPK